MGVPRVRVSWSIEGEERRLFSLNERAIEAAPDAVDTFLGHVPDARRTESSWTPLELPLGESN